MQYKNYTSIILMFTFLVVASIAACGPSSSSDAGSGVDDQSGDGDAANPNALNGGRRRNSSLRWGHGQGGS